MTILKLGGSAITDKTIPFSTSTKVVERVTREVAEAKADPLIIIHGGGSFGHPVAKEYSIASGFKGGGEQVMGYAKTRQAMMALNKLLLDALISKGVKAISVQPSAFITTKKGRIATLNVEILQRMLRLGLTPLLFGDAVLDTEKGFTILSGDQLAAKLAVAMKAGRIILTLDVDGIYTANPKTHPNSKLVKTLNLKQLSKFTHRKAETGAVFDVTGSMAGKLREMTPALKRNINVLMVNALKPGRVFHALKGEEVTGTTLMR